MSGWRETRRAARAGARALLWVVLAWAALSCKAEPFRLQVVFPETGGLKPGDNVTVRGLAIGQVADVDLHPKGVVARLEITPRYASHLDDKAVFAIADEKLVTGKRMLTVTPGDPPGAALAAGAQVVGQPVPAGPLAQAKAALDDTVTQAESAVNRAVDRAAGRVQSLGQTLLNPDRAAPRTAGGTVDLDHPGRFVLRLQSVSVYPTTADGADWDAMSEPDLLVQVWVGERQVLLSQPAEDVLSATWDSLRSEPFEVGPAHPIRVKVLDSDTRFNDPIGVAELTPTAADVGRTFRLAAGRIEALVVTLERAAEEGP